jgi:RNA polymerase sigma-70 factor (ECF subfamily)
MNSKSPDSDTSDQHRQLARQACAGDAEAARRLFADLHGPLCHFVNVRLDARLRSRLDASDIVQETLIQAHRRLGEFVRHKPMPFRIWLYKLATKQLGHARVKHLVREKRAATREMRLPDRSSMVLADQLMRHSTPSNYAMKRERNRALAKLVAHLGAVEREILLLRHLEGLSYREIATVLEISSDAARQKYVRALMLLREMCTDAGLEGDVI